jgi:hypothetical protein
VINQGASLASFVGEVRQKAIRQKVLLFAGVKFPKKVGQSPILFCVGANGVRPAKSGKTGLRIKSACDAASRRVNSAPSQTRA